MPRPCSIKQEQLLEKRLKKTAKFLEIIQRLDRSEGRQHQRSIKYWCQDETRLGLKTLNGKKITAQGVKAVGAVQWQFEAYYLLVQLLLIPEKVYF